MHFRDAVGITVLLGLPIGWVAYDALRPMESNSVRLDHFISNYPKEDRNGNGRAEQYINDPKTGFEYRLERDADNNLQLTRVK